MLLCILSKTFYSIPQTFCINTLYIHTENLKTTYCIELYVLSSSLSVQNAMPFKNRRMLDLNFNEILTILQFFIKEQTKICNQYHTVNLLFLGCNLRTVMTSIVKK